MNANNFRFRLDINNPSLELELPLTAAWDLNGVNDSIDIYEEEVIRQVINPIDDFETTRYSHKSWIDSIDGIPKTSTKYEFYFYSANTDSTITGETTCNNWVTDYRANGISTVDVLFQKNVFKSSFFKLDFYDTKNANNQQIYLTIILPTRQGELMSVPYGPNFVEIKKPVFNLDFIGDKEGYFIYWLKKREFVDINTLYMTAKFYDANIGQFKRLMTQCQGTMAEKFNFNNEDYFYYGVNLDYTGFTYDVFLTNKLVTNLRVGTDAEPIRWYEYVNPPVPPPPTNAPAPTPTPTPIPKIYELERCFDGRIIYGKDTNGLNIIAGDCVRVAGAANAGCWQVTSESTATIGATILPQVFTDCSCSTIKK